MSVSWAVAVVVVLVLTPGSGLEQCNTCIPEGITYIQSADDRMGSNYRRMIMNYNGANSAKIPYCITPWTSTMNDLNGPDRQSNASRMFEFLGGYYFGAPCCHNATLRVSTGTFPNPDLSFRDEIFSLYLASWKPPIVLFASKQHVVLHIRRGDVCETCRVGSVYWRSNERIVQCMHSLRLGGFFKLLVFSQGSIHEFESIRQAIGVEIEFFLDFDVYATFHHMVMAEVLVVGMGNFALTASYLNHGRVVSYHDDFDVMKGVPNFKGPC